MAKYFRKGLWSSYFIKLCSFWCNRAPVFDQIVLNWHFGILAVGTFQFIPGPAGKSISCNLDLAIQRSARLFPQASFLFMDFTLFSTKYACCIVSRFPRLSLKMVVISSLPSFSVQHPEIQNISPANIKWYLRRHIYVELEKVLHLNKIRVSVWRLTQLKAKSGHYIESRE